MTAPKIETTSISPRPARLSGKSTSHVSPARRARRPTSMSWIAVQPAASDARSPVSRSPRRAAHRAEEQHDERGARAVLHDAAADGGHHLLVPVLARRDRRLHEHDRRVVVDQRDQNDDDDARRDAAAARCPSRRRRQETGPPCGGRRGARRTWAAAVSPSRTVGTGAAAPRQPPRELACFTARFTVGPHVTSCRPPLPPPPPPPRGTHTQIIQ